VRVPKRLKVVLFAFSPRAAHPGRARARRVGSLLQGRQQGGTAVRSLQGARVAVDR
jgi:hypothetical protein